MSKHSTTVYAKQHYGFFDSPDGGGSPPAAGPPGHALPTFANRWVETSPLTAEKVDFGKLLSASVDWLTTSIGKGLAGDLLRDTVPYEAGFGGRGFKKREFRDCMGGQCLRAFDPIQDSKVWGKDYESWEWSGQVADLWACNLRGQFDLRPSRVDVAFDFSVDNSFQSDDFMSSFFQQIKDKEYVTGTSGQGGIYTHYIGSMKSDKRIRIYRKDLQSPMWRSLWGPTLRVELVLKGGYARSWWAVWASEGRCKAFQAASAAVESMSGLRVFTGDSVEGLKVELPEEHTELEKIYSFIKQNASTLALLADVGFDFESAARKVASRRCRQSLWRDRKRADRLRALGISYISAQVERMLEDEAQP